MLKRYIPIIGLVVLVVTGFSSSAIAQLQPGFTILPTFTQYTYNHTVVSKQRLDFKFDSDNFHKKAVAKVRFFF